MTTIDISKIIERQRKWDNNRVERIKIAKTQIKNDKNTD